MGKYEIEEETGGYVRKGDVLEWVWKDQPAPGSAVVTSAKVVKRKRTTRKAKKK